MKNVVCYMKRISALALCVMALAVALPLDAVAAEIGVQKTVRVGWFENLFNITGANGERSGFGYEYQQTVSSYTGWSYEYLEGDWAELLRMLEA